MEKITAVIEKVDKVADKVEVLTQKVEKLVDQNMHELNPTRRFFLETGKDGYNHTTWIAIRDRHHPSYKSNRNDVVYEDKDVVFYAKSVFDGNNHFLSYHTPSENWEKAREVERHLSDLEGLSVLSHFVVNK